MYIQLYKTRIEFNTINPPFFLISWKNIAKYHCEGYIIEAECQSTNMKPQKLVSGWLGQNNDITRDAIGEYSTLDSLLDRLEIETKCPAKTLKNLMIGMIKKEISRLSWNITDDRFELDVCTDNEMKGYLLERLDEMDKASILLHEWLQKNSV